MIDLNIGMLLADYSPYVLFIYIGYQEWKNWRKNKISVEARILDSLKVYEDKNILEHKEIMKALQTGRIDFDEIKKDISDIFLTLKKSSVAADINRDRETTIRDSIASALPYFSNESLKNFLVLQCNNFSKWTLESSSFIFNDIKSLELAQQQLLTLCDGLKISCPLYLNSELCDKYFELKYKELEAYLVRVRKIFDDRVNDRVNRFIRTSIEYMQTFISLLLSIYIDSLDHQEQKDWKKDENIDGLEELRRIEKNKKIL